MTYAEFLYIGCINFKPKMNPLRLSPLPSPRGDDPSQSMLMEREGFVDEALVMALMTGPLPTRQVAFPEDLALPSDDLDFAGWQLSPNIQKAGLARRASPPFMQEPGIGTPHLGAHRWWLAGLAGVFSTLLFSLLLLSLASRAAPNIETVVTRGMLTSVKPASAPKADTPNIAPELTEISPLIPRSGSDD